MDHVIGFDLSLTSPGVCRIPFNWGAAPEVCYVTHFDGPETPLDDMERARRLDDLCSLLEQEVALCPGRIKGAVIEGLPTHQAHNIGPLAELHGVVRLMLLRRRIWTRTAPLASARKLLLGKLPQKDAKKIVEVTVPLFGGCGCWTSDEIDAFVVANWMMAELGESFVSCPVETRP